MVHGTLHSYKKWRCRCDECRAAMRDYYRRRNAPPDLHGDALSDLLHELFPNGLTSDCPRAREQVGS